MGDAIAARSLPVLAEGTWIQIMEFLDVASVLSLRQCNVQHKQMCSLDPVWHRRTKSWAHKYGPCIRAQATGLTAFRHFANNVWREITFDRNSVNAVSVYNQNYYCVVDRIQLTPVGLWISYLVRGDMSLGQLQAAESSRLTMQWREPAEHQDPSKAGARAGTDDDAQAAAAAAAAAAPGPILLLGAGEGGRRQGARRLAQPAPQAGQADGDGGAAAGGAAAAPPVGRLMLRRCVVGQHEAGSLTNRRYALSGRLFFPKAALVLGAWWSFTYGEGGYSTAPLIRIPPSRVPPEWRWPSPPAMDDEYWPDKPWLPRDAGITYTP